MVFSSGKYTTIMVMKFSSRRILLVDLLCKIFLFCTLADDIGAVYGCSSSIRSLLVHGLVLSAPPNVRLALGQEESLRQECLELTSTSREGAAHADFFWEPTLRECNHELVTRMFECVAAGSYANEAKATTKTMWLPRLVPTSGDRLDRLARILNVNSKRLGNVHVEIASWPRTPATQLEFSWPRVVRAATTSECGDAERNKRALGTENGDDSTSSIASALMATETWVQEKLCGMALCPYTSSLARAAVGLESVGVQEGPILIRHASDPGGHVGQPGAEGTNIDFSTRSPPPAAVLLSLAFWRGVMELATARENEVATLLILAPRTLDDDFVQFAAIFDNLIEPSVQATDSEKIVGRALFHPRYNSTLIGHDTVIAGHALPAQMVEGFLELYFYATSENGGRIKDSLATNDKPNIQAISRANDAVRWTPHATINLLRRSQLRAAKEAEAASANKKPNWIYARNVLRLLKT